MSDKQKYQLKKLRLERELLDKATRLALIVGSVFVMVCVTIRVLWPGT
jgi:hypothetical protein